MARAFLDDEDVWEDDFQTSPYASTPHSLAKWGWLQGSGCREDGGLWGKPWLTIIFPGGHWQGVARDA